MRLHGDPVKPSPQTTRRTGFSARWLEGWELLIPSVGVAVLALWLALPQPTLPSHLPLPTLAPAALAEARTQLQGQAAAARRERLPFEIRALGERFRQIGRGIHAGIALTSDVQNRYREQVRAGLAQHGAARLLELRAIQTELFVSALQAYEITGQVNEDLTELGGNVLELAVTRHWVKSRKWLLDTDERRALFLLRWTELAGLSDTPDFRLASSWQLLAARPRLRAPLASLGPADLKVIDRVTAANPEYPGAVAKGLLYAQLGAYPAAAASFREYLIQHPDAPYSLRARNHLVYVSQNLATLGR